MNTLRRAEATFSASVLAAYVECSPEIQAVVREMIDIINSDDADPEDRNAAINTLCEALWPQAGGERWEAEHGVSDQIARAEDTLRDEHQSFSDRVRSLMQEKGISQEDLAQAAGISQPAVSNILNRHCRPQRRTIARFAAALGVDPEALWPLADSFPAPSA